MMTKILSGALLAASLFASVITWVWVGERTAHTQTKERYKAAQREATLIMEAAQRSDYELRKQLAENSRAQSEELHRETVAAVDSYARANPVRMCPPAQGRASGAPAPSLPDHPGPIPEPSPDPDMAAVPRTDLDNLAEGAVQGAAKTLFLRELVDAGVAIPLSQVEFGPP